MPPWIPLLAHLLIEAAVLSRVLLRRHRAPSARLAWVAVVLSVPLLGALAYLLLGELNLGRGREGRHREITRGLPVPRAGRAAEIPADALPAAEASLFRLADGVNGYPPTAGNAVELLPGGDPDAAAMVEEIDRATSRVHVLFYIWLDDPTGRRVADALQRAAARGVTCRAMVDGLGSRGLVGSGTWAAMQDAGVRCGVTPPLRNPLQWALRPFLRRTDLRNHRKLLTVDGRVAFLGSRNCADPAFAPKARFGPWVDVLTRVEGPVVAQVDHLFACDWSTDVDEPPEDVLRGAPPPGEAVELGGVPTAFFGTGPQSRGSAMPEAFASLFGLACETLTVSTPYYVPNEAIQTALCSAARRGVRVKLVVPARNDSWIVGGASRSFYEELLDAGVELFEFHGGLLHAKTAVADGVLAMVGSANLDRRSFELNSENNLLVHDAAFAASVRARQDRFLADATPVTAEAVAAWPRWRHAWNNTLAMLSPVL